MSQDAELDAANLHENQPVVSQQATFSGNVGRVSVKAPTFYRTNPTVWFRQMESQFVLAGVSSDATKFHHILASLPEDVAINLPMEVTSYEDLKVNVTSMFQKSKTELIEEALGAINLEGQKPSICLLRIQRKLTDCNLSLTDDVLKHRLMQALPPSTRAALSGHLELSVNQFAKLADTIYSYSRDTDTSYVAAVSSNPFATDFQRIPRRQPLPHSKATSNSTNSIEPFATGQKPKICRFHVFYADKARRCKPWCKWPGQRPTITDPSSRAASPNRQQQSEN